MTIQSYKGRSIDNNKPVRAYFNLHKHVWSIKQGSLVVAHTESIVLVNTKFEVNENKRQQVIAEGRKNVHAYIKGFVPTLNQSWDNLIENADQPYREAYYNPYKVGQFVDRENSQPLQSAHTVFLNNDKKAYYIA